MTLRALLAAAAALTLVVPVASAQQAIPLSGQGENIEPIARVKVPGANEVEMAGDWAFVSTDLNEDEEGSLTIVNIADPENAYVQSRWLASDGGLRDMSFGDVDLSPDGNTAYLTNAHCEDCDEGEVVWVAIVDVTDKSKPRLVGKILDDDTIDYVHTSTIDNNTLYLNPQVAAFYPQTPNAHISVFDVSDRANPVKKGVIAPPGGDLGLAHDTYIDHRPDGKDLMYAASIHQNHVIDVTDPLDAGWLQTTTSPSYTISHDAQPNHDRTIIVVDDEGAAGGQLDEAVSACGKVGSGPASLDSGSVHFFEAAEDGTFANGGVLHLGSFNAPTNANKGACVAHVFWQAPDENRLTQAYYRTGAFIVEFEDPADPKMLGWFVADGDNGANYWSHKPHRGYLFASDQEGHLDILRYTGEGGTRWPATAGPAEVQRAARQGVPYTPMAGATTDPLPAGGGSTGPGAGSGGGSAAPRQIGRFAFKAKARKVPGRRGTKRKLVIRFRDAAGKRVGKAKAKKRAGRRAKLKVRGVAVAGRYRWVLKAKGRRKALRRGEFTVAPQAGVMLSPSATLIAKAR